MPRISVLLGVLISVVFCSSQSFSHGAIAVCPGDPRYFSMSNKQNTKDEAESVALKFFERKLGSACTTPKRLFSFSNECIAFVLSLPHGRADEQVQDIFVSTGRTEEEARSQARRECSVTYALGCITVASDCDVLQPTSIEPPEPAAVDLSVGRNQQSAPPVHAKPPAPTAPQTNAKLVEALQTPDSWLSTLHDYRRSAVEDVRSSIDIENVKTVALIAATLAVSALVVLQLISLIRTGQRRARDLVFQAAIGAVFVCVGTLAWFITLYTTKKLISFGATLSLPGKMLLGSSAVGAVLLALPYSFWRMLGNLPVYWSPPRAAPADQGPPQPAASSDAIGEDISIPKSVDVASAPLSTNVSLVVQPPPQPIQLSQDTSPQEPIVLRLKRSQKDGFRSTIYMLDARIDVSAEIRSLIEKHKLGKRVIYESEARQRHAATTRDHLEGTRSQASLFAPARAQAADASRSLWELAKAGVSATRAALALQVTVSSLMAGVHVECKSMDELLDAESAIRAAKGNLEGYVEELQKFDGTEEIVF